MNKSTTGQFLNAAWFLVACCTLAGQAYGETHEAAEMKTIEGRVWYRERMLLPADAQIEVSLQDVAKMDVPADIIATLRFRPEGGPPFTFSLEYDPSRIHSRGRYAIRARIDADGRLLSTSMEHIGAFDTKPGQPVDIMVSSIPDRIRPHSPGTE